MPFKKGMTPWNKGMKGICLNSGRTHFKKGHIPEYPFKKGNKPWNTGKKRPEMSGKNHPRFKGKTIDSYGYVLIYKPNHPFCSSNKYVRRSHLVIEEIIDRYLLPEEVVHHKGTKYPLGSIENKQDDRPENLQLFDNQSKHTKFHHTINSFPYSNFKTIHSK